MFSEYNRNYFIVTYKITQKLKPANDIVRIRELAGVKAHKSSNCPSPININLF